VTDLDDLIRDLDATIAKAARGGEAIVSKGALNIKQDWRRRWSGHPHIPHLPSAIGYDLDTDADGTRAVIGPDHDSSQGPLAAIIEFGTSRHGPPIPGGAPALDAEDPKFFRAVQVLGDSLLEP
jgi:hypothetical protein